MVDLSMANCECHNQMDIRKWMELWWFPRDPHLRIAGGEAWSDASPTSWDGSPGYGTANGFGHPQEINGLDGHCLGKLSFGHGGDRGGRCMWMLETIWSGPKLMYPLVICYIAIENGHRNSGFSMIFSWKMVIFHSFLYVYQRVS